MKITIIIPHYKTGKMTAYSIFKILQHSDGHEVDIIVVDNNVGDGSVEYLSPFMNKVGYVPYPKDRMQSHGIGIDWVLQNNFVSTDYFITLESDSFPIEDGWLNKYEAAISQNIDAAGSILKLSGGTYLHPCGAIYKKSVWREANEYIKTIDYDYFPNMSYKDGFDCHLMVHNSITEKLLENPDDYIELAEGYKPYNKERALERLKYYNPTCCVFHHGVGMNQEALISYGQRNLNTETPKILLDNKVKLIRRVGYEPGQFFTYWMAANNKKIVALETEVKWMPNREGQQQEYTLNSFGVKHLWGISSYTERGSKDVEDIYNLKTSQPDELYNFLPENLKIKINE